MKHAVSVATGLKSILLGRSYVLKNTRVKTDDLIDIILIKRILSRLCHLIVKLSDLKAVAVARPYIVLYQTTGKPWEMCD